MPTCVRACGVATGLCVGCITRNSDDEQVKREQARQVDMDSYLWHIRVPVCIFQYRWGTCARPRDTTRK